MDVRDIGSRLELFVDDYLIEEMTGTSLRLHRPVPSETLVDLDTPWDTTQSTMGSVVKDGDKYRYWYRAGADLVQRVAYAESDDGIHWTRPSLGLVEYDGSTDNNIVIDGSIANEMMVFVDCNPATPDSERYKGVSRLRKVTEGRDGIRGFTSSDGIHWDIVANDPLILAPLDGTKTIFDSQNGAFWDEVQGQYVFYGRSWLVTDIDHPEMGYRSIRRATSPDFLEWTDPVQIDLRDSPNEHLYTNAVTPYFRAPHIYLGFPRRFVPERKFIPDFVSTGISEGVFMTSRDGVHWDRRFLESFLPGGTDLHNWGDRSMTAGFGVVPTGPGEISLYYKEHNLFPDARIRRGALRTDGFASVNAPYGGGEFVTRPLTFAGKELVMNYSTSVAGHVQVEVQDAEGRPIQGHTLADSPERYGDEVERVVEWSAGYDLGALAGTPIRLRFAMKEADLYSIRFR